MTLPRTVEAVNVGLSIFADALRDQGAPVVEVDWRPPAGGDPGMLEVLTRLWGARGDRIAAANAQAVERIEAASPRALTVAPAGEVVPRHARRAAAALGPADRVGARLRPAAAGTAGRGGVRGLGAGPGRGRAAAGEPARSRSSPATSTTTSGR